MERPAVRGYVPAASARCWSSGVVATARNLPESAGLHRHRGERRLFMQQLQLHRCSQFHPVRCAIPVQNSEPWERGRRWPEWHVPGTSFRPRMWISASRPPRSGSMMEPRKALRKGISPVVIRAPHRREPARAPCGRPWRQTEVMVASPRLSEARAVSPPSTSSTFWPPPAFSRLYQLR
jgi:hypothetical protein